MNTQELLDKLNTLLQAKTDMSYIEIQIVLDDVSKTIDNTYVQGCNDGYDSGFSCCLSMHNYTN